jgi:hypothetical protein
MRAALICLILLANSAHAEWVNLWEERERLLAVCAGSAGGSPACKELVRVLREIGLLDDALAAQEETGSQCACMHRSRCRQVFQSSRSRQADNPAPCELLLGDYHVETA